VINPDAEVEGRFRKLISRDLESRFVFLEITFEDALVKIKSELKKSL
jgi:hypothetical protein